MDSSTRSSQATCESPSEAIFTITPLNAEARFEFSTVVDWLHEQDYVDDSNQGSSKNSALRSHTSKYMYIAPEPIQDNDVAKMLRQRETGLLSSSPPSSPPDHSPSRISPSSTQPSSHTTAALASIWTGFYFLDLGEPPYQPARGWTAGRLRSDQRQNDIVLSLTGDPRVMVRQNHAILQLSNLGRITIRGAAHAACFVNNTALPSNASGSDSRPFHIHDLTATLTLGHLKYRVAYTPAARSIDYRARVEAYLLLHLGQKISPLWNLVVETPHDCVGEFTNDGASAVIQIGEWQLSRAGTVGVGASGRVSIGINDTGQLVAMKRFAVEGDRARMRMRKDKLKLITQLARKEGEERVLRLREILQDDAVGGNNHAVDVWFVLEPAVPLTLIETCRAWSLKDRAGRLKATKHVLLEILGALHFLHTNDWIHGDLKPNNVGVMDQQAAHLQIVLLDMDEAFPVLADGRLYTLPPGSTGGTVGWLSPEREMIGYDQSCDLWSLGVLVFWLVTGQHPWNFAINPWRPGRKYEELRPRFHAKYQDAIPQIRQWEDAGLAEVVLQMLRHPYAVDAQQRRARVTVAEAMIMLESDESPLRKRMRER